MRIFILLAIALLWHGLQAQSTDEKLASQFFDNGEYEKAADLYKKLQKQSPNSIYLYENYLSTLVAQKNKKDAVKLVEKQIKRFPSQVNYKVDLGYVYVQFDEKEKAYKYYDKLIKKTTSEKGYVILLAQSFSRRQMQDKALTTYELATQKHGTLTFYTQLLSAYRTSNNAKDLTDFALEVLYKDPNTLDYITRVIDVAYEKEENASYLRERTLLYAQKNPSNAVYDEFLLEILLQQKKYSAALRQVIALDKRNKSQGARTLKLANLCVNNQEYGTAIKAYENILGYGKTSPYYLAAEHGLINALYLKTTETINPKKEEISSLISRIEGIVGANTITYQSANSLFRLAELQVFYNDNTPAGIKILEKIIATPRIKASLVAKSKLLLGDAYLMQNNIWDAKLMYGQVDKQYKEDPLGQEAKFKNAKLSYYTGDFEWAKSQLDILKTATTQLISNNAIELSLLIQDNTGLDSTEDAMIEYAEAEFYLYQNNIDECTKTLNMLPFKYPNHSLNDEIYYLKAKVQEKQGNYEAANTLYKTIYEKYPSDILADNSLYRSANITLYILKDRDVAQSLFEKLVLDYNSSLYATQARKTYFGLKEGKSANDAFFKGINY